MLFIAGCVDCCCGTRFVLSLCGFVGTLWASWICSRTASRKSLKESNHKIPRTPFQESSRETSVRFVSSLGRAIHGPIPVQGETLEELSGPLVHTNFPRKRYGPMIGPYEFPPKFVWTNGTPSSVKVSVLTGIGPYSALPCKHFARKSCLRLLQIGARMPRSVGQDMLQS